MPAESEADLQRALEAARLRAERAAPADRAAAREAVRAAERKLAAARREPHAVPIAFPVQWDTGAPLPHLLRSDNQTFLAFFVRHADDAEDGTSQLAVVAFGRCLATRMGTPNDEALSGHPLYGKGLEYYAAQRVENSPWIRELEAINASHPGYRPGSWSGLTHYILGFHDCTFECVAESFHVEVKTSTLDAVLAELCGNLTRSL